jgi:hypothetical protein
MSFRERFTPSKFGASWLRLWCWPGPGRAKGSTGQSYERTAVPRRRLPLSVSQSSRPRGARTAATGAPTARFLP